MVRNYETRALSTALKVKYGKTKDDLQLIEQMVNDGIAQDMQQRISFNDLETPTAFLMEAINNNAFKDTKSFNMIIKKLSIDSETYVQNKIINLLKSDKITTLSQVCHNIELSVVNDYTSIRIPFKNKSENVFICFLDKDTKVNYLSQYIVAYKTIESDMRVNDIARRQCMKCPEGNYTIYSDYGIICFKQI